MANTLNGNTFYVDTAFSSSADDLVKKQVLVDYIVVTATGANGRIVIADVGTNPVVKLDLRVATANTSEIFRFAEKPLRFPNGITITLLANAVATIVTETPGG